MTLRRLRDVRARLRLPNISPLREKMVQHIQQYITKKQNTTYLSDPKVRKKIRTVAMQIEMYIYKNRTSNPEYSNPKTLHARIAQAHRQIINEKARARQVQEEIERRKAAQLKAQFNQFSNSNPPPSTFALSAINNILDGGDPTPRRDNPNNIRNPNNNISVNPKPRKSLKVAEPSIGPWFNNGHLNSSAGARSTGTTLKEPLIPPERSVDKDSAVPHRKSRNDPKKTPKRNATEAELPRPGPKRAPKIEIIKPPNARPTALTNPRSNADKHQLQYKRRANRIAFIIHAKRCTKQKCEYNWCPLFKELIAHIQQCKLGENCTRKHCYSTRDVWKHFQECKDKKNCRTCSLTLARMQQPRQSSRSQVAKPRKTYVSNLVEVFTQTQFRLHFSRILNEFNAFYTTQVLQQNFGGLLKEMCDSQYGFVFSKAVDADEWGIPEYKTIIENPMDLGTVRKRLDNGSYQWQRPQRLHNDVCLVFSNAMKFAKPGHMIYKLAKDMMERFQQKYEEKLHTLYQREALNRKKKDEHGNYCNCALCGGGAIFLQPPIFYCMMCNKKINRNSTYYASDLGDSRQYCPSCYNKIKDKSIKDTLVARKHSHTPQESWIECEKCQRWFHHICGLFNPTKLNAAASAKAANVTSRATQDLKTNNATQTNNKNKTGASKTKVKIGKSKAIKGRKSKKNSIATAIRRRQSVTSGSMATVAAPADVNPTVATVAASTSTGTSLVKAPAIQDNNNVHYTCPLCMYQERLRIGAEGPAKNLTYRSAKDLPITKMTTFIQKNISNFLNKHRILWFRQQKLKAARGETLPCDPGHNLQENFSDVYVRCVSNVEREYRANTPAMEKNQLLLEWMKKKHNYTLDFKGRTKAILLFQQIDQVDVCFFAMYVQEYDEETAHEPNRKSCYIAYLDSVKYFRPKKLRTKLYYELLLSYFRWVKMRGFTRAYIWSCPPQTSEQDYILYCHPKTQKTPNNDRLRTWYRHMVIQGHERKLIASCQTLHNAHMKVSN